MSEGFKQGSSNSVGLKKPINPTGFYEWVSDKEMPLHSGDVVQVPFLSVLTPVYYSDIITGNTQPGTSHLAYGAIYPGLTKRYFGASVTSFDPSCVWSVSMTNAKNVQAFTGTFDIPLHTDIEGLYTAINPGGIRSFQTGYITLTANCSDTYYLDAAKSDVEYVQFYTDLYMSNIICPRGCYILEKGQQLSFDYSFPEHLIDGKSSLPGGEVTPTNYKIGIDTTKIDNINVWCIRVTMTSLTGDWSNYAVGFNIKRGYAVCTVK